MLAIKGRSSENGEPADPPTLEAARPDWAPGDTIPLGVDRALWVTDIRSSTDAYTNAVLVVREERPVA